MLFKHIFTYLPQAQFWTLLGFAITVPFSKAFSNIFIVATAVLWLLQCAWERKVLFPKTSLNWLILLFLLSLFISLIETQQMHQSIRGISKVMQRFGLFFLTIQVLQTTNNFKKFVQILSAGYVVILTSGFVQYFFGFDIIRVRLAGVVNQMPRITSSFEFPSQYAIYLIYMILLYGMLAWDKTLETLRRLDYFLLGFLGFVSLILTFSRSGWIAFFSAIVICAFYLRRALLVFIGIITLFFLILLVSPADVLVHKDFYGKEQSISERFILWGRAFQLIKEHPLTGVGINTYIEETKRFVTEERWFSKKLGREKSQKILPDYYAHNSFLQIAAESGLITIALYFIFLGSFFYLAIKRIKDATLEPFMRLALQGVVAGTAGFIIFNCFESSLFSVQPAQIYYFFLGIGVYLIGSKPLQARS